MSLEPHATIDEMKSAETQSGAEIPLNIALFSFSESWCYVGLTCSYCIIAMFINFIQLKTTDNVAILCNVAKGNCV